MPANTAVYPNLWRIWESCKNAYFHVLMPDLDSTGHGWAMKLPFLSWVGNDNLCSSNALGNDYLDSANALGSFFIFLILKAKANSVFQLLLPPFKSKTKTT